MSYLYIHFFITSENIEFTDQIYSSSTVHKITKTIPEIYGCVDISKHKRVGAFSDTDCHLPYKVTCTNEGTSDSSMSILIIIQIKILINLILLIHVNLT